MSRLNGQQVPVIQITRIISNLRLKHDNAKTVSILGKDVPTDPAGAIGEIPLKGCFCIHEVQGVFEHQITLIGGQQITIRESDEVTIQ